MADPHFRLCVSVYEMNKIIHGCLEIWSLSSCVQFDLPLMSTPLVAGRTEHSKIKSIYPRAHVLFSMAKPK